MGKGSKSRTRDTSESLTVTLRSAPKIRTWPTTRLTEIQDFRSFDFSPGTRPAKLFSGSNASVGYVPNVNKSTQGRKARTFNAQLAFNAPAETLVCVRRSRRKEVLFAKKKTGKGGQRKPRRTPWSQYKC